MVFKQTRLGDTICGLNFHLPTSSCQWAIDILRFEETNFTKPIEGLTCSQMLQNLMFYIKFKLNCVKFQS